MNSRKIIINVLDGVLNKKAYSNILLNKELSKSELDSKDKALVTEIVYGTLKYKKALDFIIKKFVKDLKNTNNTSLNILRSAIYQMVYLDKIPEYAAVNEAVELAKEIDEWQSKFVNGVLRSFLREKESVIKDMEENKNLAIKYSFPEWIIKMIEDQYGEEDVEEILEGLNERPSVTVRVNTLKSDYDTVFDMLQENGYDVEEGIIAPEAIVINGGKNIEDNPLFKEGFITVQDESAMLISPLLDLEERDIVLDLCAAPGGKTTHIAEILNNTGRVYASDVHEHKLDLIRSNAKRLGAKNIRPFILDATRVDENLINYSSKILLDVPCSGLGIIRKKPEIKWEKSKEEIKDIIKVQRNIMDNAWKYLKNGGTLVYSTCTINKEENEENIKYFLQKHKNAKIERIFVGKERNLRYNEDGTLTILPNKNMDGFFVAKLKKTGR